MTNKDKLQTLTDQEEAVMRVIWQIGKSCVVRDVLEKMDDPKPPYTTLASVFKNLESKGYLSGHLTGKTRIYDITVSKSGYTRSALSRFVSNYFGGSYGNLVHQFAKEEKISGEELRSLLDLIDKGDA